MLKRIFKLLPRGILWNASSKIWHKYKKLSDSLVIRLRYGSAVKIVSLSPEALGELRKNGYESQFGQDYFISEYFFRNKKGLVFVDVGANNPIRNSNSFFFEKNLGWRVVGIDAQPGFQSEWERHRSAQFVNACVGAESGTVNFIQYLSPDGWEDQLSCVASCERAEDVNIEKRQIAVNVIPLTKILEDCGVTRVDVISIDVEGYEAKVLSGIDFAKIQPMVILVENCRKIGGDESIRKFMNSAGYDFKMRIWTADDVYVKRMI